VIGSVTSFDGAVGLGVVTTDDEVDYPFHCTQILDGSRDIEVGTSVSFELAPRLGRWEAVELDPR
jgi:CspA family cold shock protein